VKSDNQNQPQERKTSMKATHQELAIPASHQANHNARTVGRALSVAALVGAVALLGQAAKSVASEHSPQQLTGNYLGLVAADPKSPGVTLAITGQDTRSFSGLLSFPDRESLPLPDQDHAVKGVIAASGNCTIQADSDLSKLTLKLNWLKAGGGAAGLMGDITVATLFGDGSVRFNRPVILLRPFNDFAVGNDWAPAAGRHEGRLASIQDATSNTAQFDIAAGSPGLLAGSLHAGGANFNLVGTSSGNDQFWALGVAADQFVVLSGRAIVSPRDAHILIEGEYAIHAASGKLTDTGIIAILIGRR
jgi:hypothetical protein